LDVTKIVAGWVNDPKQNFGMVLQGEEENLLAYTEKSCVTGYETNSIRLDIKYNGWTLFRNPFRSLDQTPCARHRSDRRQHPRKERVPAFIRLPGRPLWPTSGRHVQATAIVRDIRPVNMCALQLSLERRADPKIAATATTRTLVAVLIGFAKNRAEWRASGRRQVVYRSGNSQLSWGIGNAKADIRNVS